MSYVSDRLVITILETSDIHGHILPIEYANNQPIDVGLAKISTLIQQQRQQHEHVLLIDNGDLIQGTPLTYHHARIDNEPINPMVKVLDYLRYDAVVFGNHEFNYGQSVLQKAIDESSFPWLSANILDKNSLQPYYGTPYIVRRFDDVCVGVLGLTTPYIPHWENPAHIDQLVFEDAVVCAKRWIRHLREVEKVDVIIVSYHGGFERDIETGELTDPITGENQGYQLCEEVKGIDVLLTGHQHREIAGVQIHGVSIVQPGFQGKKIGKVSIVLEQHEGKWLIVSKTSELLSVEGVETDQEVVSLVVTYENETQKWLDQPIGHTEGDMRVHDPLQVRLKDHALIEFINHVQMETAGVTISNTALFDNVSPGFPHDITMRDIVSNYIYPNTLRVIRISGQDIKDALEISASYFTLDEQGRIKVNASFTTPKPQHYNYDMWEGIEYKLNISRPIGQRVVYLMYEGAPLDPNGQYDVVMNNYRAGGGGNYTMFQGKPVVRDIPTDVAELLANYILEQKTIRATVNLNWEVITD